MNDVLFADALRVLDRYATTLPLVDLHGIRELLHTFIVDGTACRADVLDICLKIDNLIAQT